MAYISRDGGYAAQQGRKQFQEFRPGSVLRPIFAPSSLSAHFFEDVNVGRHTRHHVTARPAHPP